MVTMKVVFAAAWVGAACGECEGQYWPIGCECGSTESEHGSSEVVRVCKKGCVVTMIVRACAC